jgi:hypothetical protein
MRLRCGLAQAQSATVDPNANAATKAELALLYSLISASSGHVFQSHQQVERQCGGSCSNSPALGILPGGIGTGYCNGSWGDPNTPMCVFGSGSDTNIQAKAAWAKGELVQMDMHFPNPFDNYQNQPSGEVMANACSGGTVLSRVCQAIARASQTLPLTT